MGAPSHEQIDEAIADGLARRLSEAEIVGRLATLERMSDEELAAVGIFVPAGWPASPSAKASNLSPSMSPSADRPVSPSPDAAPERCACKGRP